MLELFVPHSAEQVLNRHDAATILRQIQQNRILNRRASHGLLVHRNRPRIWVDHQPVDRDELLLLRLVAASIARISAKLRLHARHELKRAERLNHVIVCAERQALDLSVCESRAVSMITG